MPYIDGYALAQRIRALDCGKKPVLIALTGYGQPKDRERALAAGFDHHLIKPLDFELLGRILDGLQVNVRSD